jgi:arylsulfatase
VRQGKWKLVALHKKPWELYDLDADRTELNNLASAQPERVAAMEKMWDAWAAKVGAVPPERLKSAPAPRPAQRRARAAARAQATRPG